jgi:FtsH-binding integral membrane protein
MEPANPYAYSPTVAAEAPVAERAAFLQRTYSLLLLGIFGFAFTLWAAGNLAPVRDVAVQLWRGGPWVLLIATFAGAWLVQANARRYPLNLLLYFAYVFLFGLLLAPIVLYAAGEAPQTLTQAAIVTALVFTGLTAYVFTSRRDFSFLGGALAIGFFALLGIALGGWLFGFTVGLWFSVAAVVLFAGYVLYDTSQVLHHYRTDMAVAAAAVLFVDVVLLFKHLLILFLNNRD